MSRRIFRLISLLVLVGILVTTISSANPAQEQEEEINNLMAESLLRSLHIVAITFENKVVNMEKMSVDVMPIVLHQFATRSELTESLVKMERRILAQGDITAETGILGEWIKASEKIIWPPWPWPWPWPWPDSGPFWLLAVDAGGIHSKIVREFGRWQPLIEEAPEKAAVVITESIRLISEWIADEEHIELLERQTRDVLPIFIRRLEETTALRERWVPLMEELGEYSEQEPVRKEIRRLEERLVEYGVSKDDAVAIANDGFAKGVIVGILIGLLALL